jgi:hypothetical protein
MGLIVGLVSVVVIGGMLLLFIKKVRGLKGQVDAAKAEFRQQVGYEYASTLTVGQPPTRTKDTPQGRSIISRSTARARSGSQRRAGSSTPRSLRACRSS